jgi:FkbM family methyltransferase
VSEDPYRTNSLTEVKRRGVRFFVYENETPSIPNFWAWDDWESHTYKVLESFLDKDHSYIDAGVHLGQTVLYGAELAKTVYAVEPDSEALRITGKNIHINGISNVKLLPKALGGDSESIKLGCPNTCPALGSSRTAAFFADEANSFEAESISLPSLIESERINDLNFLKIDVEGMEDVIIENAGDLQVPIYVEIHTPWLSQKRGGFERILDFMRRYKNLTLFQCGGESSVSVNDLSKLYVEEEKKRNPYCEGFFSVLGF